MVVLVSLVQMTAINGDDLATDKLKGVGNLLLIKESLSKI